MAGQRQPINLLLIKGNKNLTKKEIEERKKQEIKAPADKVRAPSYLSKEHKKEFNKIAAELQKIEIISNLDVDALARYIISRALYLKITDQLLYRDPIRIYDVNESDQIDGELIPNTTTLEMASEVFSDLLNTQDKLFKQCRQAASDLGLTIASRCRLVVPKAPAKGEPSPFDQRFGDV
ncbi:phage terminase small subunit P27 family [Paenibacillus sp. Marseille-Q4541]|uniref:phage terminase small subunit P27 family n=1 Tax=Paenibacillus sp. Marseille-Q4541 TaxID=2831522 RepID=UPI001BA74851|nr:phage terminase small subunit P27 family [Paenibacillus sp. Marseille-Q4541]